MKGKRLTDFQRKERLIRKVERMGRGFPYKRAAMFGWMDTEHDPPEYDTRVFVDQAGWSAHWITTKEVLASLARWAHNSYQTALKEAETDGGGYQCGGCRYFAALDNDYGLCCNPLSVNDGRVTFEHGGCDKPSMLEEEVTP